MTETAKGTGRLGVRLESDSMFLGNTLPIEIRNARHELVRTVRHSAEVELPEGLYSVSAVLADGARHTHLAHVTRNTPANVVLTTGETKPAWPEPSLEYRASLSFTMHVQAASYGVAVGTTSDDRLYVYLHAQGDTPPWILFRKAEEWWWYALPLSTHDENTRTCVIDIEECAERGPDTRPGFRPILSFAPGRRVAGALHQMMVSGKVGHGIELAKEATELLRGKYSDPIAAAYGGLLLHRFGVLEERVRWVENLARDFPWLPDGRILLAALLSHGPEQARGLEILLAATMTLPTVFSEAFSLAISLLRRWPSDAGAEARQARLRSLRGVVGRFDFASSCSLVRSSTRPRSPEWGT